MWDRLSSAPESAIAAYLLKEHPQTFALVLSKLSSGAAARIMAQTPRELRNGLMRRMLSPRPVMDPMMKLLERTLHEDLLLNVARNTGADTHSKIADIINKMERDQIEDVLAVSGRGPPQGRGNPARPALHLRGHRQAFAARPAPPCSTASRPTAW